MTTRIDQYILKLLVDHLKYFDYNISEYEAFGFCCMEALTSLFTRIPKYDSWSDFPKLSVEERDEVRASVAVDLQCHPFVSMTEDEDKNDKLYLDAYGLNFIDDNPEYFEFYDPLDDGCVGAEFFMRCISHRYYETITKFQAVMKKQSMVKTIRNLHLTGSV